MSKPPQVEELQDSQKEVPKGANGKSTNPRLSSSSEEARRLFNLWAPIYHWFMAYTNHYGAIGEIIKACFNKGATPDQKILRGRGLEIGTGTGFVITELGYWAKTEALQKLNMGFLDSYAKRREIVKKSLEDPKDLKDPEVHSLLMGIKKLVEDDSKNDYLQKIDQFCEFREQIESVKQFNSETWANFLNPEFKFRNIFIHYLHDVDLRIQYDTHRFMRLKYEGNQPFKTDKLSEMRNKMKEIVDMTAIDISLPMLGVARKRAEPVYGGLAVARSMDKEDMFQEMDALELETKAKERGWVDESGEGIFDFCVMSQVVRFFSFDELEKLTRGIATVLKRDGKLLLIDEKNLAYSGELLTTSDPEVKDVLEEIERLYWKLIGTRGPKEMRTIFNFIGRYGDLEYTNIRFSCEVDRNNKEHIMYGYVFQKMQR
ncbi:MAG: class I SAM-dependent methyltransferase [Candidatus Bilamarchaeaceae archaeon]